MNQNWHNVYWKWTSKIYNITESKLEWTVTHSSDKMLNVVQITKQAQKQIGSSIFFVLLNRTTGSAIRRASPWTVSNQSCRVSLAKTMFLSLLTYFGLLGFGAAPWIRILPAVRHQNVDCCFAFGVAEAMYGVELNEHARLIVKVSNHSEADQSRPLIHIR